LPFPGPQSPGNARSSRGVHVAASPVGSTRPGQSGSAVMTPGVRMQDMRSPSSGLRSPSLNQLRLPISASTPRTQGYSPTSPFSPAGGSGRYNCGPPPRCAAVPSARSPASGYSPLSPSTFARAPTTVLVVETPPSTPRGVAAMPVRGYSQSPQCSAVVRSPSLVVSPTRSPAIDRQASTCSVRSGSVPGLMLKGTSGVAVAQVVAMWPPQPLASPRRVAATQTGEECTPILAKADALGGSSALWSFRD